MNDEKEMTALDTSVGADDGRSLKKCTGNSIAENDADIKSFEELQRELLVGLSMMCYKIGIKKLRRWTRRDLSTH